MLSIFIQWIPGHSVIPGNKLSDKAAKEAPNTILPIPFSSSIQVINETIPDDPPSHKCVAQVHQHQKASRDSKQIKNRKDDVLLARLRYGHHPSLHQYLHRPDQTQNQILPSCRPDERDRNHNKCLGALTLDLGMWRRTQRKPWSTLRPNQVRSL